jgi:effector-binding domain-containing protein
VVQDKYLRTLKRILRISVLSLVLLLLVAGIFLYNRPCDYQVSFTTEASPDVVYFHLLNWRNWNRKLSGVHIKVIEKKTLTKVCSQVVLPDTLLDIQWRIEALNDSITEVSACVSDPERRLKNRLTAPLFSTAFRQSVRSNILDLMQRLESMRKTFHVEFRGPAHFEARDCVYMTLNCHVRQKAATMISTVAELNQFVRQNKLGLEGHPFLLIHDWKVENDSICFDFCFPIRNRELIPSHPLISFKHVDGMEAVQSDFYGNYSITDLSWFRLAEEAEKMGYTSTGRLLEVYHNDPHGGGNELEWKAEIFLGVQKEKSQQ